MSLWDKLKAAKPKEATVDIDDDTQLLIIGLSRVAKTSMVAECTKRNGKIDNAALESKLLAACVHDPETREKVQPDPREWDVAAHISGPCIAAAMQCCGFDDEELEAMIKKSEPVAG
jgi:hypothetical protein